MVAAEVRKKEADLLLGGLIWICKKRSKLLAAPEISVFRWLVCYLATNCSDREVGKKRGREGRKGEGKKPLPSPSSPIPFDACHAGYELLQTVTTTKQKLNFKRVVCQSCLVHFVNSANLASFLAIRNYLWMTISEPRFKQVHVCLGNVTSNVTNNKHELWNPPC